MQNTLSGGLVRHMTEMLQHFGDNMLNFLCQKYSKFDIILHITTFKLELIVLILSIKLIYKLLPPIHHKYSLKKCIRSLSHSRRSTTHKRIYTQLHQCRKLPTG